MTVADVFGKANLSPCGPVRWGKPILKSSKGVYVIARVDDPTAGCTRCELPFVEPIDSDLVIDRDFESQRWLRDEPVVYIGKADQPIEKRVGQFYRQKCGDRSPHAGGQVILLLNCDLWVYWSPADYPRSAERTMLCEFEKQVGKVPFANFDGKKRLRRIRRLS